jgi:predicted HicB family RNase H-like nuclease
MAGKERKGVQTRYVQGERKANLTVRITDEAMRRLIAEAEARGISRTAVVEMAIRSYTKIRGTPKK